MHSLIATMLLLPTLAVAQDRPIVADCSSGSGAVFTLSQEDEATSIKLLRLSPRPFAGAIIVLRPGYAPYWDARSRRAIDIAYGGNGEGTQETSLFGGIQPRSGMWQAEIGATELVGCPAILRQYFPGSPGALPAETAVPRRLDFDVPFHPEDLALTRAFEGTGLGDVTWRSVSDDAWEAEILGDAFAGLPAFGDRRSALIWRLTLMAEDRIGHLSSVTIAFPDELRTVLGEGADTCRAISRNAWVRVGD